MVENKQFYSKMPKPLREFMSEFFGTFVEIFPLLSALIIGEIQWNSAKRLYNDPIYDICSTNSTQPLPPLQSCSPIPEGKRAGDSVYEIRLSIIYMIIISLCSIAGKLGGLMMSVPVSGGYHNPGITLCLATMSRLEWQKLYHFLPAQYLGAFVAALAVHANFYQHFNNNEIHDRVLITAMAPKPHPDIGLPIAFLDGIISSAVHSLFVFACLDSQYNPLPRHTQPVLIVFSYLGIYITFSINRKGIFNPAEDLGPRVYALFYLGFHKTFGDFSGLYWVSQQISLYLGTLLGGWGYVLLFVPKYKSEEKSNNGSNNSNTEQQNNGRTLTNEEKNITNQGSGAQNALNKNN